MNGEQTVNKRVDNLTSPDRVDDGRKVIHNLPWLQRTLSTGFKSVKTTVWRHRQGIQA